MTSLYATFAKHVNILSPCDTRIRVGCCTYGTPRFLLWHESEHIEIGKFCSIADEVIIFGGGEHRTDWVTTYPLRTAFGDELSGQDGHPGNKGPTRIGNDVWLGHGSVILSGVSIGDGAVVGARAVVACDVAPYSLVVGNPVRVLKRRFSTQQIEDLLAIRWWDWPLEKIREAIPFLCSHDINRFIEYAKQGNIAR